ncbi:type IV pilin protein [Cellulomonas sp.]|uniref:type IV pilin protein n=1 Tax=Cellulomonas sp. TaxID=40001 RepID=UPI003BABCCCD
MVIIIIGVLAAIAIPTLLNQRRQAFDATVKSDLHNVAVAVTAATHSDTSAIDEAMVRSDIRLSPANTVAVVRVGDSYCLRGWHSGSVASRSWAVVDGSVVLDDGASCTGTPAFVLP